MGAPVPDVRMLRLARDPHAAVAGWAVAGYPREACGLLIGRIVAGGSRVSRAAATRNLSATRSRERFEIDSLEILRRDREAQACGLEVVGIWHSHPDQPADPYDSSRDLTASGQLGLEWAARGCPLEPQLPTRCTRRRARRRVRGMELHRYEFEDLDGEATLAL